MNLGGLFVRKGYKQMPDQTKILDDWRQDVLMDFTDHRIVSSLWVDTHIWFYMHLYADLLIHELTLDGWSVRQSERDTLLVLKLTKEDIPYVVFVTSSDPTHCMRKTRDLLRNGGLNLVRDRFR